MLIAGIPLFLNLCLNVAPLKRVFIDFRDRVETGPPAAKSLESSLKFSLGFLFSALLFFTNFGALLLTCLADLLVQLADGTVLGESDGGKSCGEERLHLICSG